MKHYRVSGALKEDGSAIEEVVVALSEQHAVQKANAVGVVVNRVELIHADSDDLAPPGTNRPIAFRSPGRLFDPAEIGMVRIPMLISAISNIIVGLFWASTIIGIVLAIPMWIVCVFEFVTHSRLDGRTRPAAAHGAVVTIGIFEILLGLFNIISFICGILVLVGSGSLRRLESRN